MAECSPVPLALISVGTIPTCVHGQSGEVETNSTSEIDREQGKRMGCPTLKKLRLAQEENASGSPQAKTQSKVPQAFDDGIPSIAFFGDPFALVTPFGLANDVSLVIFVDDEDRPETTVWNERVDSKA